MAQERLTSSSVLVHFNPKWPIILACDASPYGVEAVISHVLPDGRGAANYAWNKEVPSVFIRSTVHLVNGPLTSYSHFWAKERNSFIGSGEIAALGNFAVSI